MREREREKEREGGEAGSDQIAVAGPRPGQILEIREFNNLLGVTGWHREVRGSTEKRCEAPEFTRRGDGGGGVYERTPGPRSSEGKCNNIERYRSLIRHAAREFEIRSLDERSEFKLSALLLSSRPSTFYRFFNFLFQLYIYFFSSS